MQTIGLTTRAVGFVCGVVLVGLDNVHEELEHPYDGLGPDDLRLDIASEVVGLLTRAGSEDGLSVERRSRPD